jgi:hypothetical protein
MTEAEIRHCRVGDRVKFIPLKGDAGEPCGGVITHKVGSHVEITWDDGAICSMIPFNYTRVFWDPEPRTGAGSLD